MAKDLANNMPFLPNQSFESLATDIETARGKPKPLNQLGKAEQKRLTSVLSEYHQISEELIEKNASKIMCLVDQETHEVSSDEAQQEYTTYFVHTLLQTKK
ncbi:MAG: hypothetical protein GOV15_02745 [Candidatus Diapherotrites archaeon]|nr:hypothetical protein [Candidatus Diapherotrites archaeon]